MTKGAMKKWQRHIRAMERTLDRLQRRAETRQRALRRRFSRDAGLEEFKRLVIEAAQAIVVHSRRVQELVAAIGAPPKKSRLQRAVARWYRREALRKP